jgi:hypothetical protein
MHPLSHEYYGRVVYQKMCRFTSFDTSRLIEEQSLGQFSQLFALKRLLVSHMKTVSASFVLLILEALTAFSLHWGINLEDYATVDLTAVSSHKN